MPDKKKVATAASVAIAGLVVAGGATAAITANAQDTSHTNGAGYGYGAPAGYGAPGQQGGGQQNGGQGDRGHGPRGTEVTGTELAKVKAAVVAKYPKVTVEHVMKDSSGAYHVMGTQAGTRVGYDVSKDLATITVDDHQGRGGHGGSNDTVVTGSEATSVTNAVKAKDSAVTVERVQKDPDGSYDVFGTKAGNRVMFEVSKDLKTVTQNTQGPRDGRAGQQGAPGSQQAGQQGQVPA